MNAALIVYAIGASAVLVWTLVEMRRENAAGKVLLAFLGPSAALVWPILLAATVGVGLYLMVRSILGIEP